MAPRPVVNRTSQDAIKTYRYLRIGIIGAVGLLATSIGVERGGVACWQTSVSAYYYTPVRGIFIGTLVAVGLALIVYKGRSGWEDTCLNFAGGLAPAVALAPTTDIGECWSIPPDPLPIGDDGLLASWVVSNIDNNVYALLIAGSAGFVITVATMAARQRSLRSLATHGTIETRVSIALTAVILLTAWWLIGNWDAFYTQAHGYAAVLMFAFLVGAIIPNATRNWADRELTWFWIYAGFAALMVLGAIVIASTRFFGDHTVLALEIYEIALFTAYWIAQTVENWNEQIPGYPAKKATE